MVTPDELNAKLSVTYTTTVPSPMEFNSVTFNQIIHVLVNFLPTSKTCTTLPYLISVYWFNQDATSKSEVVKSTNQLHIFKIIHVSNLNSRENISFSQPFSLKVNIMSGKNVNITFLRYRRIKPSREKRSRAKML